MKSVIISRAKNDLMTFLNLSAITKLSIPSYITADIADDDVVTEMGLWSQKLLLFDNATLYNEGEILGTLDDDALIQRLTQKAIKK